TNELSDMTPYTVPRRFAMVFDQTLGPRGGHRFDGIRWRTRFDTGSSSRGAAFFGDEGEHNWVCSIFEIAGDLKARLHARLGTAVASPPLLEDLDEAFVINDGVVDAEEPDAS